MELLQLRRRLETARRGHKLLKDKQDELTRRLRLYGVQTQRLRRQLAAELSAAQANAAAAEALCPQGLFFIALETQTPLLSVREKSKMSMGVMLPEFEPQGEWEHAEFPYGYAQTPVQLDHALCRMGKLRLSLLRLAEEETAQRRLRREIEQTRRRVNAMEYTLIPQLQEGIRRIAAQLEENERGAIVRLMKMKDILLEQALRDERRRTAALFEAGGVGKTTARQ